MTELVTLKSISLSHASLACVQSLGLPVSEEQSLVTLCAEAIRSALWLLYSAGKQPIFTSRLLHAARKLLLPWQSDELTTTLRETLYEMRLNEEVAYIKGGYWLPAPLRVVPLDATQRWLLLGSYPSRLFTGTVRSALEWSGTIRLLTKPPDQLGLSIPVYPLTQWLAIPSEDVGEWTKNILHQTPLIKVSELQAEIYAPAYAASGAYQWSRWKSSSTALQDGRYLVREPSRFQSYDYYIAEIQSQKIIAVGSINPDLYDVRRIQYGLDMLAGNPTVARIEWRDGTIFTFHNALPRAEYRLLVALGQQLPSVSQSFYPQCWKVSFLYSQQMIKEIKKLGVKITTKK